MIGDLPDNIAFGKWSEDSRLAGEECRRNLRRVKEFVGSWPKQ